MYEDTLLPVRSKLRIPSKTRARIYFVQKETKRSFAFIKWLELILALLCLCFTIPVITFANIATLDKWALVALSSISSVVTLMEITYPYFNGTLPLLLQILGTGFNVMLYVIAIVVIYNASSSHDLTKILLFLEGISFMTLTVEFVCKIIISTYLYQITRVKSTVDVGVTAYIPSPIQARNKLQRASLSPTPITYGGTFPIGKNQPPFLPDNPPADGCTTPERGVSRSRSIQTTNFGDSKTTNKSTLDLSSERVSSRPRVVQMFRPQEHKGTSTVAPFYLEEERRKKSPWTCTTPSKKRRNSMSTPITYSGTFAVNKELVPITPGGATSGTSPKTSPRGRKPPSRSEGNSPSRIETTFADLGRLDQISEEKISLEMSSENCSISRSNCAFYEETGMLPGSVLHECEFEPMKKSSYELI